MPDQVKDSCFCTLALGKKYRLLTSQLAQDLALYSPQTPLVVLTDKPEDFLGLTNVLAFKHKPKGVKFYQEKRLVIAKAISMFNACIFVDADMRILGDIPTNLQWCQGITARTGSSIIKHNKSKSRHLQIIEKVAQKMNLNLTSEVKFINEFLFTVTRSGGKEQDFLQEWEKIAYYFELHGIHNGEGNAIGLAAAKSGLSIQFDSADRFPFFKDKIERMRIKHGKSKLEEKLIYFEQRQQIEINQQYLLRKGWNRLNGYLGYNYRALRLRLQTLNNYQFYYQ